VAAVLAVGVLQRNGAIHGTAVRIDRADRQRPNRLRRDNRYGCGLQQRPGCKVAVRVHLPDSDIKRYDDWWDSSWSRPDGMVRREQ